MVSYIKIDAAFEEQLLPSLKWLQKKAEETPTLKLGYYDNNEWKDFYRNVMSQVISKRYHQQGDFYKEVLGQIQHQFDMFYRE